MAKWKEQSCVAVDTDQMTFADYLSELKETANRNVALIAKQQAEPEWITRIIRQDLFDMLEYAKEATGLAKWDWAYHFYYAFVFIFADKAKPVFQKQTSVRKELLKSHYNEHMKRLIKVMDVVDSIEGKLEAMFESRLREVRLEAEQAQKKRLADIAEYISKTRDAEDLQRQRMLHEEANAWLALTRTADAHRPLATIELVDAPEFTLPPKPVMDTLFEPAAATSAKPPPSAAMVSLFGPTPASAYRPVAPAHSDPTSSPLPSAWTQELKPPGQGSNTVQQTISDSGRVLEVLLAESDRLGKLNTAEAKAEQERNQQELQRKLQEMEDAKQREADTERARVAEQQRRSEEEFAQKLRDRDAAAALQQQQQQYQAERVRQAVVSITYYRNILHQLLKNVAVLHQECQARWNNPHAPCRLLTDPSIQTSIQQWEHALQQGFDALSKVGAEVPHLPQPAQEQYHEAVKLRNTAKSELDHACALAESLRLKAAVAVPSPYPNMSSPSAPLPQAPAQPQAQQAPSRKGLVVNRTAVHQQSLQASYWSFPSGPSRQVRRGLVNLGNTCYMNSTLQSLMATGIVHPFLTQQYQSQVNTENPMGASGRVANTFASVVHDMNSSRAYPVSPSQFKMAIAQANPMFEGQRQQDANEFMQTLLGYLHEDLNTVRNRQKVPEIRSKGMSDDQIAQQTLDAYAVNNRSCIADLFGFLERSAVCCPHCAHQSVSFSVQQSLQLPIRRSEDATVADCISKYTEEEQLPEGSEWKCDGCGRKVRAKKQLSLWSTPATLVMTLSRFRTMGNLADKIRQKVRFGPTLDVSPFISNPSKGKTLYDLVAVVNHDGGMGGGHYTADVRGREDKSWHWFSDDRFRPSSGSPDFEKAYVLYYKLRE
eukprot:TRINITY_DN811_c0_g1_i1.p1 TRINITY_DN811_c0_g1~~TRINITY_DN811_c0_g1_i1.p1  ORF type:complete len:883 (+),score=295.63 TRINITY_DN811_c0_g1_i1:221-2869(+)